MKGFIRPLLLFNSHTVYQQGFTGTGSARAVDRKHIAALILYQLTGGKSTKEAFAGKKRPHKTPCIAFEQGGLIVDTRRKRTPTKTNRSKAQDGREGMGQGTFTGCKALHGKHHGSGSIESKLSKQGYTQKKILI